jgi:hypothetical protein
MPIVETPSEAIDFFLECDLDVLVIENFIVHKTSAGLERGGFKRVRSPVAGC